MSNDLVGTVWRHRKRGTEYRVLRVVRMQASDFPVLDLAEAVIYASTDNDTWWVRPLYEFLDGRFERIDNDG